MSDLEFIGVVYRKVDGTTVAIDLSREDLELILSATLPTEVVDDVTESGRDDWMRHSPPGRVEIAINGKRRPGATKLLTYRIIKDGETPFPAWECAE